MKYTLSLLLGGALFFGALPSTSQALTVVVAHHDRHDHRYHHYNHHGHRVFYPAHTVWRHGHRVLVPAHSVWVD